jgi:Ca2+/H+ antiporter
LVSGENQPQFHNFLPVYQGEFALNFIAPAPMDLDFKGGLIFMLLSGTLTVALTSNHGKSTWYVGVLLMAVYLIFGVMLYFLRCSI